MASMPTGCTKISVSNWFSICLHYFFSFFIINDFTQILTNITTPQILSTVQQMDSFGPQIGHETIFKLVCRLSYDLIGVMIHMQINIFLFLFHRKKYFIYQMNDYEINDEQTIENSIFKMMIMMKTN